MLTCLVIEPTKNYYRFISSRIIIDSKLAAFSDEILTLFPNIDPLSVFAGQRLFYGLYVNEPR